MARTLWSCFLACCRFPARAPLNSCHELALQYDLKIEFVYVPSQFGTPYFTLSFTDTTFLGEMQSNSSGVSHTLDTGCSFSGTSRSTFYNLKLSTGAGRIWTWTANNNSWPVVVVDSEIRFNFRFNSFSIDSADFTAHATSVIRVVCGSGLDIGPGGTVDLLKATTIVGLPFAGTVQLIGCSAACGISVANVGGMLRVTGGTCERLCCVPHLNQ